MIKVTNYLYVSADQIERVYGDEHRGVFICTKDGGTYPAPRHELLTVEAQIEFIAERIELEIERDKSGWRDGQ